MESDRPVCTATGAPPFFHPAAFAEQLSGLNVLLSRAKPDKIWMTVGHTELPVKMKNKRRPAGPAVLVSSREPSRLRWPAAGRRDRHGDYGKKFDSPMLADIAPGRDMGRNDDSFVVP